MSEGIAGRIGRSGSKANQDQDGDQEEDDLIDDGDDLEETDDSNFVSSSNADLEAEDDVTREDACWRQDLDEQEEPSNLRSKAWLAEKAKLASRNIRLLNAETPAYACAAAKMSDLDCGDDCAQPDGAVGGGGSIGLGSSIADSEDLFSVGVSSMNLNPRAASLPPHQSSLGNRQSSSFASNGWGNSQCHLSRHAQQFNHQQNNIPHRNTHQNHQHQQSPNQPPQPAQRNHSPQRNKDGNLGFYNWQSTKMTVKERLTFLFNNTILSDVIFVVGRDNQQQRIPAHRFVLSVGSAVFDAMFNSTWPTSNEEIPLPDVEPASFLALLKFLYSDEVQICPETVMTTLYTAKKYAVPALEKNCVDYLKRHLCADNAFLLLTQARLFDEPQLAAMCLETIDKATPDALSAEGFTDIDVDTLSAVLDRDSLRIKEAKLFTHVIRWSEAECLRQGLPVTPDNKRSVLGPVLSKIRFPLMTVGEFAQGPAQSGILADRESVSLFLHFTVNPKPPVGFLDVPRCSMTGKEQTVCRFQQIESRWGYSGTADKIRFIVDRKIFVVGFGLYGSIHGPSEYQVNIQILQTGANRTLGSNENSFLSDGTNATFRVMFKEPIEIQPNTNYTASATLKGLDSHYGTKGLRKVTVDCPTGGKVTFQFSYAAGNNNGTSVEDGQIPEIIFYT